jgi:hypothetical protein
MYKHVKDVVLEGDIISFQYRKKLENLDLTSFKPDDVNTVFILFNNKN